MDSGQPGEKPVKEVPTLTLQKNKSSDKREEGEDSLQDVRSRTSSSMAEAGHKTSLAVRLRLSHQKKMAELHAQKETWERWLSRVVVLIAILAPFYMTFAALFSAPMGWGFQVTETLAGQYHISTYVLGFLFVYFTTLYVIDISYWGVTVKVETLSHMEKGKPKKRKSKIAIVEPFMAKMRRICTGFGVVLLIVGAVLSTKEYPAFPCILYLIGIPLVALAAKKYLYSDVPPGYFLTSISAAGITNALIMVFLFAIYIDSQSMLWTRSTRSYFVFRLKTACYEETKNVCNMTDNLDPLKRCSFSSEGCYDADTYVFNKKVKDCYYYCCRSFNYSNTSFPTNYTGSNCTYPTQETVKQDVSCVAALLLISNMLIASTMTIILGILAAYLGFTLQKGSSYFDTTAQIMVSLSILVLVGIWIGGEISIASPEFASVIFMFGGFGILSLVVMVGCEVGWSLLLSSLNEVPIIKKMGQSIFSDWFKAMALIVTGPLFLIYVAFSFLNQTTRYMFGFTKDFESPEEAKFWVTKVCHEQIVAIFNWRWTSVLVKAIYLGILFLVLQVVVAKWMNVGMSALNSVLETLPIGLVIVIFYIVGLTLFLLPPIPGVPVYIMGGLSLVGLLEKNANISVPLGCLLVTCLCLCLKLNAVTVQQKLFGEGLGSYVSIRQACGVNSITIKAIRVILTKPGMTIPKVAILVGGPDWPTSVLTGIMKLNVFEMLYGTLPAVVLIICPCVMTGAFMVQASKEGGKWNSYSSIVMACMLILQSATMITALSCIESTANRNLKEIMAMPNDKEVEEFEGPVRARNKIYHEETKWEVLPFHMKFIIVTSFFLMAISCHVQNFFPSLCYVTFGLSDSIQLKLGGNPLNLMTRPYGWLVNIIFILSWVLLIMFEQWAKCKVSSRMKEMTPEDLKSLERATMEMTDDEASALTVHPGPIPGPLPGM